MAKITDPDNLNQNTEVEFITGSKLIRLNRAGNLSNDGVSLQSLYSFIKEEWKDDNNLVKFPIPMLAITTEQFELINGWDFSGSSADVSASQWLVRDGGWAVVSSSGDNMQEWMNITTLGTFDNSSTDLAYYYQTSGGDIPDIQLTGEINQPIQTYASDSFDYRSFFKVYLREQGKTFGFYDLILEQNLTTLDYKKFAMPLSNGTDLNISSSDDLITGSSPWTGMSVNYYTESVTRSIGGVERYFKVVIDGNAGNAQQIYEYAQFQLRTGSNIDSQGDINGGVTGSIAEELLEFVGSTLKTKQQTDVGGSGAGGVYIDNFQTADTNNLVFVDDSGVERTFPFVAAGTLLFNDNLQNDTNAVYKLFFTNNNAGDNDGADFGTENAIIINDNSLNPITGSVSTSASIVFDYDYDSNVQRGNDSSGSDIPFTGVAIGLETAQYVVTTGTWTRSTTNAVNFVAALERNYSNT